ncbi:MAG: transcriptional repressor NrdR [Chloroflexi bacterium]|nr:transcriptional repressor NrdR [Chloroflexota bacterium]
MKCPYCGYIDSKVIDSRDAGDVIRRRRECLRCALRFTTHEKVQTTTLLVIKRDGRREEFDREKLSSGIRKACAKRPLPMGTIEKVVDDIEAQLLKLGKAEVSSSLIGEMVMEKLRTLDRVAYVRFASVYREFADIKTFKREIDALLEAREPARPKTAQLPLIVGGEVAPKPPKAGKRRGSSARPIHSRSAT